MTEETSVRKSVLRVVRIFALAQRDATMKKNDSGRDYSLRHIAISELNGLVYAG